MAGLVARRARGGTGEGVSMREHVVGDLRDRSLQPSSVRSDRLTTDEMSVYCWCMARIVYATPHEILNSKTRSCGREGCHE